MNKQGSVVAGYTLGKLIIEGKTKQVWEISNSPDEVLVLSKDRITAGDGVKSHELKGKAEISNKSNGKVFELLNGVGLDIKVSVSLRRTIFRTSNLLAGIPTQDKLLALKMVLCNETELSASSPVHSVHIQTWFNPEDDKSDIDYDNHGNLSKKISR